MANGKSVSAGQLTATLWEMNEMPLPRMEEGSEERRLKKEGSRRERIVSYVRQGSLPHPIHLTVLFQRGWNNLEQAVTGEDHHHFPKGLGRQSKMVAL